MSHTLDADENVCLVTEDNVVIDGGGKRAEMRQRNLWHRATYVLVHHVLDQNAKEAVVFVQKRSKYKDYCPGCLDPLPGGVVGYGESYGDNARRELEEEMGFATTFQDEGNAKENTLRRLFTFSYENDRVKVWGDFYVCKYRGRFSDLILQSSEVEGCERMTLSVLKEKMASHPEQFMPDACYAMGLYFQYNQDILVGRRHLADYQWGNLQNYQLRARPQVVFFDCDDCLYFDGWKTANLLTKKIDDWCVDAHGLKTGEAYHLYKKYGTALKGLLKEGHLSDDRVDEYLQNVHDVPLQIQRDEPLRELILSMDPSIPRYIFTASVEAHAKRCIDSLGIADLFLGIVDCKKCGLETKHSPSSFSAAMEAAGVTDPQACLLLDDSLTNLEAARKFGWRGVLVGRVCRDDCRTVKHSEHAELEVDVIHDIAHVLPELFKEAKTRDVS